MLKVDIFLKQYFIILFLISAGVFPVLAQDVSYSQSYASPLYLSPSFTGLTDGSRLALNYREQWPGIPNTYKTVNFAIDHYFRDYNSGLGLMVNIDDQGGGMLIRQDIGLLYAYEITVSNSIMIRPGLQFKYAQNIIHPSKITDVDGNGETIDAGVAYDVESKNNFDATASILIYSDFYWGGVAIDHLVKNDIAYTDLETTLDKKYTFYAGTKWVYKEGRRGAPDQSVTFAANYRKQRKFSQLDLGLYWMYNPIEAGLWYRGIPVENKNGYSNNDAIIMLLGLNVGPVRFSYSYDFSLSGLASHSAGSNEISIIYRFNISSSRHTINRRAIPCSQPGYSGGGSSRSKYRGGQKRKIF